jgi:hypothetical protein
VLCAKKEERRQWQQWAADCNRTDDLVIVDSTGKWRFNFLDWEASRPEASGGLTINIVSILDEIAGARGGTEGQSASSGVSRSEQRRYFVEPARFTTLKRGGANHNFQVESIVYNGGHRFPTGAPGKEELLPYKMITFNQK